jgi:hypothetical protein
MLLRIFCHDQQACGLTMKVKILQAYDSQIDKLEGKINEWLHELQPLGEEVKHTNVAAVGQDGTAKITKPLLIATVRYD